MPTRSHRKKYRTRKVRKARRERRARRVGGVNPVYRPEDFRSFDRWLVNTPAGSEFVIELRQITQREPSFIPARIINIRQLSNEEDWYRNEPFYNIRFPFDPAIRMTLLDRIQNHNTPNIIG